MLDADTHARIEQAAELAAQQFADLSSACPYPFASDEGRAFSRAFSHAQRAESSAQRTQHLYPAAAVMLTASGREYPLAGASVLLTEPPLLADIAHALANINRFTGHARRPYSVAEHSLLCERIGAVRGASPIVRLALLMHDAHEAFVSDLSSPAKTAIGIPWEEFEGMHRAHFRNSYMLRTVFSSSAKDIHHIDLIALATERRDLLRFDPARHSPWPALDRPGHEVEPFDERLPADEPPMHWRDMRTAFISKFFELRTRAHKELQP